MTHPAAKQLAWHAIEQLPDDAMLEDAMGRLYLIEKIERGLTGIREGRLVAHEDVVSRFRR